MQEIVLKRTASVTSAEALDQINDSYPDAEILSFRRIKEAGNDVEYFVARVRVAQMTEDVVVEDSQHEAEEEAMLKEMLGLLRQLVDEDGGKSEKKKDNEIGIAEFEDDSNTLPFQLDTINSDIDLEGHERRPLPRPSSPPIGSANTLASVVAERPADVPQAVARIELMREFSHEYRIASIKRDGDIYRATLIRHAVDEPRRYSDPTAPDDDDIPAHAGDATSLLDYEPRKYRDPTAPIDPATERGVELMRDRAQQQELAPTHDQYGVALEAPIPNFTQQYELSKEGYAWLNFLYEKGVDDAGISAEGQKMMTMSPEEQMAYIQSYIVDQDEFEQGRRDRAEELRQNQMENGEEVRVKDPRENPSKPIGFGDTPAQQAQQRGQIVDMQKKVNLPEGAIDDWTDWFAKGRPREDQKLYPKARGIDVEDARAQLVDHFTQQALQVNRPKDEAGIAEVEEEAEARARETLNKILGGDDAMRRLRKYPAKEQGKFLQRELRRVLLQEERDKRVDIDPTRPFAETYREMDMHPMQIANLLDQQIRLDRTNDVREVKRQRPKRTSK